MNDKTRIILHLLLIAILSFSLFSTSKVLMTEQKEVETVTYKEFLKMAENEEVTKVEIDFNKNDFTFYDSKETKYITSNPKYDNFKLNLLEMGIEVNEKESANSSGIISIVVDAIFIFALLFILNKVFKSQGGNMNQKMIKPEYNEKEEVVETSDNKKVIHKRKTSFKDVAGLKQVKADMMQLVDFLKDPEKYINAGAKLPKGVILNGPPGTGKTLLARAIAGEAEVPFFSVSGSDFIEMFVGVGAKRVRSLFEEAKKHAPCIIFIDELDAIGSSRTNMKGSDTEHRQTINALLAEMDGFKSSEGILVIAATNRIQDLDSALIRPGRFDKHITVPLPETPEERLEIIRIYAANKKFAEDVDFNALSKETIGFSPADIEALLNESILIAIQDKNSDIVDRECIDKAIFKKLLKGHAKDDKKRNEEELKLVAYHEAGHAVIGKLCNMDVSKVTIVPSTSGAGGVNIIIPKKMGLHSIEELKNNIRMSYGGKCAEYLLFGDWEKTTTGASADIKQATATIYQMISLYGMTENYGMLNLDELQIDNKVILDEAIKISNELKNDALRMLEEHRDMHQAIVDVLLEKETISGEELDEIYKKYVDKIEDNSEIKNCA